MPVTTSQAAQLIAGAVGVAPAEVPPRRFGADWFREQQDWLAVSVAADRLVADAALDASLPLSVAAALLEEEEELDVNVDHLVEVGFVEAMVCCASHRTDGAEQRLLSTAPASVWQVWHRRRERLEALSDQRLGDEEPPSGLFHDDAEVAMLARCTTYRAESGRYVVLADLLSADRPSPWPLRHPVLFGLAFLAFLSLMFALALLTG